MDLSRTQTPSSKDYHLISVMALSILASIFPSMSKNPLYPHFIDSCSNMIKLSHLSFPTSFDDAIIRFQLMDLSTLMTIFAWAIL
jgi:hypothetical protein